MAWVVTLACMPFTLIRGTFRLVNTTKAGAETGFEPDGDSMQFKPDDPTLLDRLTVLQQPVRPTNIGSVQLRFEGIDALELHFAPSGGHESHQPRPLADESRDFLTGFLGFGVVPYVPPRGIAVDAPVPVDGVPGYILARSLEVHGRPVSFVFAGTPPEADGAEVFLDVERLKQSINYRSAAEGFSYPLFYDTLFKDLREALASVVVAARGAGLGLWAQDGSMSGVKATGQQDLETTAVTFPKLFRRLSDYFAGGKVGLDGFLDLPSLHEEQVQDLDPDSPDFTNVTHFDSMITVAGDTVSLNHRPETLLFISEK
jgi:endonuclease YncB( thermonuclease family)